MATQEQQAAAVQELDQPGDAEKFDIGTASQDDLHAKAMEALENDFDGSIPEGTIPTGDKARDPGTGRFVKAEDKQAADDKQGNEADEPEEYVFEQVIESVSGGNSQVFRGRGKTEADALRDLNQKLTEAQRSATKKIHEQGQRLRTINPQQDDFKPKKYTEEDEFVISQEMMRSPTKAFASMFKDQTGYEISEFRTVAAAAKAYKDSQEESVATENFLTTHPSYVKTPKNGERLVRWVKSQGDPSKSILENLEAAYDDLESSGLLDTKADVGATDQPTTKTETQRITEADKAGATQPKTATKVGSSSINPRNRTTAAPVKEKSPAEVAKNMSQDELRDLAYQNIDQFFN